MDNPTPPDEKLISHRSQNTAAAALRCIYIPLISETDSAGPLSVKDREDGGFISLCLLKHVK